MDIDVKLQKKLFNSYSAEIQDEFVKKENSDKINIFRQILIGTIYISLLVLSLFIV